MTTKEARAVAVKRVLAFDRRIAPRQCLDSSPPQLIHVQAHGSRNLLQRGLARLFDALHLRVCGLRDAHTHRHLTLPVRVVRHANGRATNCMTDAVRFAVGVDTNVLVHAEVKATTKSPSSPTRPWQTGVGAATLGWSAVGRRVGEQTKLAACACCGRPRGPRTQMAYRTRSTQTVRPERRGHCTGPELKHQK